MEIKKIDFNCKRYHGLTIGWGIRKGTGMSIDEKRENRAKTLKKYNNNPKNIERVKLWHLNNIDKVKIIKQKYSNSEKGKLKRKECGQRRVALEHKLSKKLNITYWIWLCKKCIEEYGHDTDKPMKCPNCGSWVGCFWHSGKYNQHVIMCKSVNRREEEE